MSYSLKKEMSEDLNIKKFENETDEEYGHRLIYSALSSWAKVLVLGESYTDLDDDTYIQKTYYHNVDRMHIQSRLTQIANGLLMTLPHSEKWLCDGNKEQQAGSLASEIIDNLIFCYELSPLNNPRRLTKSPTKSVYFNKYLLHLGSGGLATRKEHVISVGLGYWSEAEGKSVNYVNYKEVFNLPGYSSEEYYKALLVSVPWQESNLEGEYMVFQTGTGQYYTNAWRAITWLDLKASSFPSGMFLLKSTDVDGGYILLNREDEKICSARLDPWYYNEKEIYRIMYMLDKHNGTPAIFKAEIYSDHVLLHCHSILPNAEMRIIHLSSWPKRTYKDIFYRIIPLFLWDEIRNILSNLGISINSIYC